NLNTHPNWDDGSSKYISVNGTEVTGLAPTDSPAQIGINFDNDDRYNSIGYGNLYLSITVEKAPVVDAEYNGDYVELKDPVVKNGNLYMYNLESYQKYLEKATSLDIKITGFAGTINVGKKEYGKEFCDNQDVPAPYSVNIGPDDIKDVLANGLHISHWNDAGTTPTVEIKINGLE
ncbi:MAG: hypothetical protein J1E29_08275, partial [Duncaniella sp.]|nr:hypothetical protein [Duncaniella sp.]